MVDLSNLFNKEDRDKLERIKFYNNLLETEKDLSFQRQVDKNTRALYYVNSHKEFACKIFYDGDDTLLIKNKVWDYVVVKASFDKPLNLLLQTPRPITVDSGNIICGGTGLVCFSSFNMRGNDIIFKPSGEMSILLSTSGSDIKIHYDKKEDFAQGIIYLCEQFILLRNITFLKRYFEAGRTYNARLIIGKQSESFNSLVNILDTQYSINLIYIEVYDDKTIIGCIDNSLDRHIIKCYKNIYSSLDFNPYSSEKK